MTDLSSWVATLLVWVVAVGTALWVAGAIYFDACGGSRLGKLLGLAWVGGAVTLLAAWEPLWQPAAALAAATAVFVAWWLRQQPSHNRDWDPSVAVLPRAEVSGDAVAIRGLRNFDYPAPGAFTPRYETRTVRLSNLVAADVIFFTWGSRWMSHPVLVFDFGPDGRVCVSVEVRYRKGQGFSTLRSLYRQQELAIVLADERDAILRRTRYATNQVGRLYRLAAPPDELRVVFLDYVAAVNALYDRPRWYHGLCMNCTTTFYRLPGTRLRLDWRVIANGLLDRALYDGGRLDTSLPFDELRRRAVLNDIANAAPAAGFGDHLRTELERRRHER
ncbi:lipoprotein N-acyltransferase Lnb domain-containing protein [Gemmata sp.]|uniref:lipoprotein N-acyltransferase Lnb domain-containing protein n=1 Tax=Gemmata sp. TaxID=1914242 RepID=UPI003F7289BC